MPIPMLLKRQCVAALKGACPGGLCAWSSYDSEKLKGGCTLRETASYADSRECYGLCTRDPMFAGSGVTATGQTAGFDFFALPWCECCRESLPRWFRDEFEPYPYDRKAWRRKRYERRERGRLRAARVILPS